ncbi:cytochrome-c peroxidase [Vitiosangium sp. GDMCC 1.1324]|uniref:cytochrome-c peroxidase n=1 Tax=Vitiosangium sp. (strain GDMCC 1.1324) TaxID=2138576 RepID=UPI000D347CE7|nr:cytochrome-c peroxidase [Vitiosangium sp. GDMCC 1.1324]PTL77602.1 cytochrome-c peroxidase [Vitiosangium sp. GDMCC 1.1324]
MKLNSLVRPLILVAATTGATAFAQAAKPAAPAAPATAAQKVVIDRALLNAFKVLPTRFEDAKNPITAEKVELGRMLYFDTRLSKNQDVSCNSCHDLNKYGVDGKPTSPGHKKQLGGRNSPTVYNAGGHILQFWDGRAPNLEEQAKGPILNPVEMAMPNAERVVETVKSIPGYVTSFQKAFPGEADPVTYDNLAKAIGAFERQLVTPSPFDKYLAGDENALTEAQKAGLKKFLDQGCQTCHNGPAIGGSLQKLGLVVPFQTKDQGRFEVTKNEADRMIFRVPTLRNVTKTGPWFHDGSVKELPTAVKLMAQHQFGKQISDDDAKSIVVFLDALTGELPKSYIAKPKLPASGPKTPKPDPS